MRQIIGAIVKVLHMLSIFGILLTFIVTALHEIIGTIKLERLLSKIGITNAFGFIWIFGATTILFYIVTAILKKVFR